MAELFKFQVIPDNISSEEQAAKGKRYKLFDEVDGKQVLKTKFDDQDEMLDAMSRAEYQTDGIYRATVQDLIKNSVGVSGVDPAERIQMPGRVEVDIVEQTRKEALRQIAAENRDAMAGSDRVKAYEAMKRYMALTPEERQEAESSIFTEHPLQDAIGRGPLAHREQLESGSVKVSTPLSPEHADLINTLSQKNSQ